MRGGSVYIYICSIYPHTDARIPRNMHILYSCMYAHRHIPTYLPTYHSPTYIHTYIHTKIHLCIHTYVHTFLHTYIYIHTYIRTCMRARMHICVCVCAAIHTYKHQEHASILLSPWLLLLLAYLARSKLLLCGLHRGFRGLLNKIQTHVV